jgi:hypothetical protein
MQSSAISLHLGLVITDVSEERVTSVRAFYGILPHAANIDNRSATVLFCKCPLLCNNIPTETHTRNSTAPSFLLYTA